VELNSRKATILFIRRRHEPLLRGPNQESQTVAQFAAAHPAGRIANWDLFCQAKRLPAAVMFRTAECCVSEAHDPPNCERFGNQIMRQKKEKIF
jgi:hypothetical protein